MKFSRNCQTLKEMTFLPLFITRHMNLICRQPHDLDPLIDMKRTLSLLLVINLFASFVLADEGMWTFDNPPLRQWKERYNFEPSKEWLDRVRLASVKFPGASGVFVSPNGLI